MKKKIIALAIASVIAAPVAMAGAPTVYGQINANVESIDAKNAAGVDQNLGTQVNDRSSRIGIKGSQDLGNGLKAIYKLEFGVDVDGAGTFSDRNQYVGLAGNFGTVLIGTHDTPTNMSDPGFGFGGNGGLRHTSLTSQSSLRGGEIRANNVIAYISPSFGGVTIAVAAVPSEGDEINDAGVHQESGLFDTTSMAIMYGSKKQGLYLAAAFDSYGQQNYTIHNGTTANASADYLRLSAQYTLDSLTVTGMFAQTSVDVANAPAINLDTSTFVIGAAYTVGNLTPRFKYSISSWDDAVNAAGVMGTGALDDKTMFGLGLDFALGKNTKTYVEYVSIDGANWGDKDSERNTFSVGLVHKF